MFSCSASLVLYFAVRTNFWHSGLANKLFSLQFENFLAPQLMRAAAFLVALAYTALCMKRNLSLEGENTSLCHIPDVKQLQSVKLCFG